MAFDSGVGFAFTGRDVSLSKTARGAASSIDMLGSSVDGVGEKLAANAENVKAFLQEFSQKQLDRIQSGLESIADSASINQTSLEGMAASASKAAKPIVTSLGLVGDEARVAKKQIVGLSIGLNVGAESVGSAVKAWKLYGKELQAVGIDSVATATKFQEVAGIQIDKLGEQVAGLARSWDLTEEQLGDLVPWILEAGKAFGFGAQAIQGMEQVTGALDQSLSKVLLEDGPQAISQFTKGIYSLALVSSKTLGMDLPSALSQSVDLFNKLAGDASTFQKQFAGLATEFGPLADQLGLALGDWHTAFELVRQDPAEFAKQMAELAQNLPADKLNRLKLTLGDNSEMMRFLIENADAMNQGFMELEGIEAGKESLKEFAQQGFSTGRTMAEQLDLIRERAKLSFMGIARDQWRPYMQQLRKGYKEAVGYMKHLASDKEPGGVGYLVEAAAMGLRFGPGGVIRALFPKGEGEHAAGVIDALTDSLVDFLPHLTALGALGFRPAMLAKPFQMALGPLKALGGPLVAFSTALGGIPGMALKIFGPLGLLTLAVGGFTLLTRKWKKDQESQIGMYFKTELPILLMRGLSMALTGKDLTKEARKDLAATFGGRELWGMVAEQGVEFFGKGLELAMEAFTVGTEVLGDIAGKLADGIASALEKADWMKFGDALTKVMFHLSSAAGKIVATTPKILTGLVKGLAVGLTKVDWGAAFKGLKGGVKGAEDAGEAMQAGFGLDNLIGAGALIGVPLLLRKFKKIKKEGVGIMGDLRKEATKGVPPEMAGLPKCVPMCSQAGTITTKGGRQILAPKGTMRGPAPPPLPAAARGYPMGPISGPGAVMQPIAKGPSWWTKAGAAVKGGSMKAQGWKGFMGMGAAGGAMAAIPGAAAVFSGEDLGMAGTAATYGMAAAMGGPTGAAIAAAIIGATGAVKEFKDTWSKAMEDIRAEGGDTADEIQVTFGTAMASISEGIDDMTGGVTETIRDAMSSWLGINKVTNDQISTVWQMAWNRIRSVVETAFVFFLDNITNTYKYGKQYLGELGDFASTMFTTVVDFGKSQIDAFLTFGKAIASKGKAMFLTLYDKVQSVVEQITLSSMTLFSNVLSPFVKLLGDMPQKAKDAISAVFPEFKVFDSLVTGLGQTIDKELTKKTKEYQIAALERQQDISMATMQSNQLMAQAADIQSQGFQGLKSGLSESKAKAEAWASTAQKLAKSTMGLAGGTPLALVGMFLPEEDRKGFFDWFGATETGRTADEIAGQWESLGDKLIEQQADQTKILADKQGEMFDAAQAEAESTLETMIGSLGEMGVKKGRTKKVAGIAEDALAKMGQATSEADIKAIMSDAVSMGKSEAEKQAIGSMLVAAGSTLFQHGAPQVSKSAKVLGEMRTQGLEFSEALMEAQLDATTTAVQKATGAKKKKLAKQKASLEQQIGMIGEVIAPPPAVAPPSTVKVGGVEFKAPTPPGGGGGGGGKVSQPIMKVKPGQMTVWIKPIGSNQPIGKGEMNVMVE